MDTKEIIEVEEKNNLGPTKSPAQNGVIITVYVESPRRQSPLRTAALEKSKPKSVPKKLQTARKRGHDRRAQLLAYARELRNGPNGGTSREVQCPGNNSTAKPKKTWKWLTSPASICFRSRRKVERTSSRWRYERIPIEENTEEADHEPSTLGSESISGKKRKGITRRSNSHFLSKLRCKLRELSC